MSVIELAEARMAKARKAAKILKIIFYVLTGIKPGVHSCGGDTELLFICICKISLW
jgi:hypothetical protein